MIAAMQSHDAVAVTVTDKLDAQIIAAGAGGKCQMIANFGVGVNHIDLAAAAQHNLPVSNTPGVLTDATADIAMTLMLMCARRAGEGERELRAGSWTLASHPSFGHGFFRQDDRHYWYGAYRQGCGPPLRPWVWHERGFLQPLASDGL